MRRQLQKPERKMLVQPPQYNRIVHERLKNAERIIFSAFFVQELVKLIFIFVCSRGGDLAHRLIKSTLLVWSGPP